MRHDILKKFRIKDFVINRFQQLNLIIPLTLLNGLEQFRFSALWTIGVRGKNLTETTLENTLAHRSIDKNMAFTRLSSLVAADDIRRMLQTLRHIVAQAKRLRQDYALDEKVFKKLCVVENS